MSQYKSLFTEVQLGAVKLRNRIAMSALTRSRSVPTNVPNSVNVEYYKQRAAGGAGLIVSEGTLVAQQGCVLFRSSHIRKWAISALWILHCIACVRLSEPVTITTVYGLWPDSLSGFSHIPILHISKSLLMQSPHLASHLFSIHSWFQTALRYRYISP